MEADDSKRETSPEAGAFAHQPVPPLPADQVDVEVRQVEGFGGSRGWISIRNVSGLEKGMAIVRGYAWSSRASAALVAMGHDEGRVPAELRRSARTIATSEEPATDIAKAIDDNKSLFDDVCGDVFAVFQRAAGLPASQRAGAIFDGCKLERFGLITRDESIRWESPYAILGYGMLVALNRIGGPHAAELALIRVLVGHTSDDAVGPGRKIVFRDGEHGQPYELVSSDGGYRAVFSGPPKQESRPGLMGLTLGTTDVAETGDVVQFVHYSDGVPTENMDVVALVRRVTGGLLGATEVSSEEVVFAGRRAFAQMARADSSSPPMMLQTRTLVHPPRLYQVVCGYPEGTEDLGCDRFFASFQLLEREE
jgi:hypothetical protein